MSVPCGCIDVLFSLAVHQVGYTICLPPVVVKMCCFLWLFTRWATPYVCPQWLCRCAVFFVSSPGGLQNMSVPSGCIDVLFSLAVHQIGYTVYLFPVSV